MNPPLVLPYPCCSPLPQSQKDMVSDERYDPCPSRTHIFSKTESGAEDLNIWWYEPLGRLVKSMTLLKGNELY